MVYITCEREIKMNNMIAYITCKHEIKMNNMIAYEGKGVSNSYVKKFKWKICFLL